jgi:sensor c-di-GMP phosphodiesterase-like protein
VTERGFIDVPKTTPVIQAFRHAGYEVAIDDFGTGYSNLHNLYSSTSIFEKLINPLSIR